MEKVDKIYLDIDGVIRGVASPREDVVALLRYCLDNYPGAVYWLTTHCRGGENHVGAALRGEFDDEFSVAASEVNIFDASLAVKYGSFKITCNEGSSTIRNSKFTIDESENETNVIQLEKRYGGTMSVYGTTFDGRLNVIGGDRFDSIKDSDTVPSSVSKM